MNPEFLSINQIEENLAKKIDLERLKVDLKLTPRNWEFFLYKVNGYTSEEIESQLSLSKNYINTSLSGRAKGQIEEILNLEKGYLKWSNPNNLLGLIIKAGYKKIHSEPAPLNQSIFQAMLDKQRDLTTNFLLRSNLSIDEVYVPLGLVERRTPTSLSEPKPEEGSALCGSDKYEVTRQFEGEEFLEEVLGQGNSRSQGRRIAIIGEPGSGKTTRLQQICRWLMSQSEENYVIWVSLGDLRGESLEDYLLQRWLKSALSSRTVAAEYQDALIEAFNQGKVWLLLDGVDEMGFEERMNPLAWVNEQITGWIASAKIILTCRLNVWESNNQALYRFDVYRNLDFSETQRDEFISKWMKDEALASRLINELNQPGKERIRDLVKNPLRLTLICSSWQKRQGALPTTRAGLYRECVEAFYNWDDKLKTRPRTMEAKREELNLALGELAKNAIDRRDNFRFRLTKAQVRKFLGHADEGLFKSALDLGWLNKVGWAEEDPSKEIKEIYAFLHPTFQEYFAALVIDDSKFFLDHVPENPDLGAYRIFEQQWGEVFLIWLEQKIENDVDGNFAKEIDELLLSMIDFDDNCKNLFGKKYIYSLAEEASHTYTSILNEVIWEDDESCQTVFYDRFEGQWGNFFGCTKNINIFKSSHSNNNHERVYEYKELAYELGVWIHQYDTCRIHYPLKNLEYQAYQVEHEENIRLKHIKLNNHQPMPGILLFLINNEDELKKEYYIKFDSLKMDHEFYKEDVDFILQSEDPNQIYYYLDFDQEPFLRGVTIRQFTKLITNDQRVIDFLIDKIENGGYPSINLASVVYILGEAHLTTERYNVRLNITNCLCRLASKCEDQAKISLLYAFYRIIHDSQCCKKQLSDILVSLKPIYLDPLQSNYWTNVESISSYLLVQISLKMTYPEFYKAWHPAPPTEDLPTLKPSQEPNFLQLKTASLNKKENPEILFRLFKT